MQSDQSAVIAFLSRSEAFGRQGPVQVIETHISVIFLVGDRAFKMKRAVKLPYADFSSVDLRLAACGKELALNRRSTPELYIALRRVTREANGVLCIDGAGETVEALVEMHRFDQAALFDRMAVEDRLTIALMQQAAAMIAAFHMGAPVIHGGGGAANLAGVLDINEAGFATSDVFSGERQAALAAKFRAALAEKSALLDRRERAGRVRLCHGDLHLRNIYLAPSGPRLFDCIDFNDQIATVDVLYDLAFLLMDLSHRGRVDFACEVANRYLDLTDEDDGMGALPFLMAVRAAVRAHVTGTQAESADGRRQELADMAMSYADEAERLLAPAKPRLVAIGGLSGSGKSTLAAALAPELCLAPGARLIESDRLRKALYRVPVDQRLPAEAYAPAVSQQVYHSMRERTRLCLESGATVVVNGVFDREPDRLAMAEIAQQAGAEFHGLWLTAEPAVLRRRVAARPKGASDATVGILEQQLSKDLGAMTWESLDCAPPIGDVLAAARRMLMDKAD